MKKVQLLITVLAIAASMAAVFLLIQKPSTSNNLNVQENSPESQQNSTEQSAPAEVEEKPYLMTEVWIITTKFNTVFVQNAESNRESYEGSYAKIVSVNVPIPLGTKIFDSRQFTTNPDIFFVIAETSGGTEMAYVLDTQQKTFEELFSSADFPDFKYAGIGSVGPQDNTILFRFSSCRGCDGGPTGGAIYNVATNTYKNIGPAPAFRWISDNTFEYKIPPSGCEAYFANPFSEEQTESSCDEKLEAASWVRESI